MNISGTAAALIGFGAVLTSVSATWGSVVAGVGVLWEAFLMYLAGSS